MPPELVLVGSLKGDPGDEEAFPGEAGCDWHDWLGGPVPLGLPEASAPLGPSAANATDAAATKKNLRTETSSAVGVYLYVFRDAVAARILPGTDQR